jgi:ribosomal protein L11 methyltransferase
MSGLDAAFPKSVELETLTLEVPEAALEAYEAALSNTCNTVAFFRDHRTGNWQLEAVKTVGRGEAELAAGLALAAELSGAVARMQRRPIMPEDWLSRTLAAFPEQLIGNRFRIRGTHLGKARAVGRLTLTLDAGLAFGSGEHGSTRGCLRALELVAKRRPRRILDLGTGSGILAIAAARLLHRSVLATDIESWSVYVARHNLALNGLGKLVQVRLADGWRPIAVRNGGSYDLVLANILARPLIHMARDFCSHVAPSGTAILSGLLRNQMRSVVNAYRRCGLTLAASLAEGDWVTLILRRTNSGRGIVERQSRCVSKRCNLGRAHER